MTWGSPPQHRKRIQRLTQGHQIHSNIFLALLGEHNTSKYCLWCGAGWSSLRPPWELIFTQQIGSPRSGRLDPSAGHSNAGHGFLCTPPVWAGPRQIDGYQSNCSKISRIGRELFEEGVKPAISKDPESQLPGLSSQRPGPEDKHWKLQVKTRNVGAGEFGDSGFIPTPSLLSQMEHFWRPAT
jgi:hypothetical protein